MCKCCQHCFESCYWHCIEKRFCWDDSIALYVDPDEKETNNNGYVNTAFYENFAVIAGSPIFTLEPLPQKPSPPIVVQPKKKLRWFENEDDQNKINERRLTATITATNTKRKMSVVPEEDNDNISVDEVDTERKNETDEDKTAEAKEVEQIKTENEQKKAESTEEDSKREEPTVQLRKKTLQQRRMSKGLTLKIDRTELPIIRQSSVPKFYLETPEENQIDSAIARTPSVALSAPIRPPETYLKFDLKSIVQIHKETPQQPPVESNRPKRVTSFKELLKRQSSTSLNSTSTASSYSSTHL